MATVEKIIYEVTADTKQLDALLDKMVKGKQLSKEQADQFRKDTQSFVDASKRREKSIQEEIQDLNELRLRKQQAFSVKEISDYNKRIEESQRKIRTLKGETEKQTASFNKMNGIVKNLAGSLIAAFSVERIIRFTSEAVKLAAEVEGVETAFNKLNRPGLLDRLQQATRGTVNNLELMRRAVQADQLNIPIERLAQLFEFASTRAIQTGKDVDDFTERIVSGLGRGSVRVLDDLGLSLVEIREELKTSSNFADAAINVMIRKLEESGDVADTTATKLQRLTSDWENFKIEVGEATITTADFAKTLFDTETRNEAIADRLKNTMAASKALNREIEGGISIWNFFGDEVSDLLEDFEKLNKEMANEEAAKNRIATAEEMARVLGIELSRVDKLIAAQGGQTETLSMLNKEYDKYQERVETGKTEIEQFIEANKAAFKRFVRETEEIKERNRVLEDLAETERMRKEGEGDRAFNSLFGDSETEAERRAREIADVEAIEIDADAREAERFDRFQETLRRKRERFAEEDRKFQQEQLEARKDLAEAQIDIAQSVFRAFTSVVQDNVAAQQALVAFDKLISVAEIQIQLSREIAVNSATLPPLLRDAANVQSRIRAAAGVANVLATAIPQFAFAEGIIDLKGKGTETSDSIPAWLSKGESVMTAKETREHKDLFKAIRNKQIDDYIFKKYTAPVLSSVVNQTTSYKSEFNDQNLLNAQNKTNRELRDINKALRKNSATKLNVN